MTIAPTMVSRTPAIAEMMAMMPEPIAEKIEPCGKYCSQDEERQGIRRKGRTIIIVSLGVQVV